MYGLWAVQGTWNQSHHSEQRAQTQWHPGSRNSGGPVSLSDLPGTSPSGVNQYADRWTLHMEHDSELGKKST